MLVIASELAARKAAKYPFAKVALNARTPSQLSQRLLRADQPKAGSSFCETTSMAAAPMAVVLKFSVSLLLSRNCTVALTA